jgi:hypothetical protein
MKNSNKVPYLLAAGAIGGAVGYLFFTDSGKRVTDKISKMRVEKSASLPDRIEDLRSFISERGRNVTSLLRDAVDHMKGSVAVGQSAYSEAGGMKQEQIQKLHRTNEEVVANLHKAVDSLGKLMNSAQETFLHPLFEMGAMARGVDRGVRELVNSYTETRDIKPIEPVSIYGEHQRIIR